MESLFIPSAPLSDHEIKMNDFTFKSFQTQTKDDTTCDPTGPATRLDLRPDSPQKLVSGCSDGVKHVGVCLTSAR